MRGISIMMGCYNTERDQLLEAINSVTALGLNRDEYEILLVNDGSTSMETRMALIEIEANRSLYPNVCVIHQENGGPAAARNTALRFARFDYLSGLDSDDRLNTSPYLSSKYGDYYSRGIAQLEKDEALAFVYCAYQPFRTDGKPVEHFSAPASMRQCLTKGIGIYAITRREDVMAAGGFPVDQDCAEDWAMIISLMNTRLEQGKGIGVIKYPEKYYDYRQHDDGRNVNARARNYPVFFRDLVLRNRSVYEHHYGEGSARELVEKLYRSHFDLDESKTAYRARMILQRPWEAAMAGPTFIMNRVKYLEYKMGLREVSPFKRIRGDEDAFACQLDALFGPDGEAIPEMPSAAKEPAYAEPRQAAE
jgi:glycosyltransferase involved in cell wall biosynthesis